MQRAYEKIKAGLDDASAIAKGDADPETYRVHVPPSIDVKAIRVRTGLTQRAFADRFGFSLGALRDWEQGRNNPDRTARAFLIVIDRELEAVERALRVA